MTAASANLGRVLSAEAEAVCLLSPSSCRVAPARVGHPINPTNAPSKERRMFHMDASDLTEAKRLLDELLAAVERGDLVTSPTEESALRGAAAVLGHV